MLTYATDSHLLEPIDGSTELKKNPFGKLLPFLVKEGEYYKDDVANLLVILKL